jgi:glucose-6-phosphate 1-dehydrogenase
MDGSRRRSARSDALVLFGVTGDVAPKMIFPALCALAKRGVPDVPVIGVAASRWSLAQHRRVQPCRRGSRGPKAADALIAADGCRRNPGIDDDAAD